MKFDNTTKSRIRPKFTIGEEAADVINVAIQLVDELNNEEVSEKVALPVYLSDAADGTDIAASAPDGGIAIGTDGLLIEWTANLAGLLVSESDGDADIDMTHAAGADTFYLNVVCPDGKVVTSGAITFAA